MSDESLNENLIDRLRQFASKPSDNVEGVRSAAARLHSRTASQDKNIRDCTLERLWRKNSGTLSLLISLLEMMRDHITAISLAGILRECVSPKSGKRRSPAVSQLVTMNATQSLVRLIQQQQLKEAYLTESLLQELMWVLAQLAQKDTKFSMKVRLLNATKTFHFLLRTHYNCSKMLFPLLLVIKALAKNSYTTTVLAKDGICSTMEKTVLTIGVTPNNKLRLALNVLSCLSKNKLCSGRMVKCGLVSLLLRIFERWERYDGKMRLRICSFTLSALQHICMIKIGRKAMRANNGLQLLHKFSSICPEQKGYDSLLSRVCAILNLCAEKRQLPLENQHSPATFALPLPSCLGDTLGPRASSIPRDASPDSDDDSNDDLSPEDLEEVPETDKDKFPDELFYLCPVQRSWEDLKQYEGNASEMTSSNWSSASLERILETRRSFALLGALNSTLSYASFMLDGSNEDKDRSPTPFADPLSVKRSDLSFADCAAEMMSSIDGRHKRKGADRVPSKAEVVGVAESHTLKLTPGGEKGSHLSLDTDIFKSPEEGLRTSQQALRRLTALDKLDARMAPRDVYCAVASCVKSVLPFVKVAFPDMVGGHSADKLEPLNIKDRKVCRAKLLSCVERSIHPSQSLNKVVFNIDLLAAQTKHSLTRALSNDDESRLGRKVPAVDTLLFESRFESGNLRKVLQVSSKEYDLILMPDVNSSRHHQWFYFEVSNMESKTPYQFNIINCEKQNSQFNFGMKPLLYSVREATLGQTGWVRTGRDICYYRNSYQNLGSKGRSYFTTTFTVEFPHAYDVCYIAYHYPYTYSQLLTQIWKWEMVVNPAVAFFRAESLCSSLNGNETPLLTITAPENKYNPIASRELVFLTARVHPGESNSSWVMLGTLGLLLGTTQTAVKLRDRFVFKVVPMLNMEGVINGCHRCGLTDEDLNRRWSRPDPQLHPVIFHTKGLIEYYARVLKKPPYVFCDYHGHSRRKNVFLYGCSHVDSWCDSDRAQTDNPVDYLMLPHLMQHFAPAFTLSLCNFRVERSRETTARVTVWREYGVKRSYTMETSFCGCDRGLYQDQHLHTAHLQEVGANLCQALACLQNDTCWGLELLSAVSRDSNRDAANEDKSPEGSVDSLLASESSDQDEEYHYMQD